MRILILRFWPKWHVFQDLHHRLNILQELYQYTDKNFIKKFERSILDYDRKRPEITSFIWCTPNLFSKIEDVFPFRKFDLH